MASNKIILCDSNIVFDYFQGDEKIVQELDTLGFARLAVSSVTVAETYYGMKKREIRKTKELINRFNLYHVDKQISQRCLDLLYEHRDKIEIPDAFIASTALEYNVELYTLNVKDFDFIEGIKFYKPKF